jgi:hypothetical protein
MELVLDGLTELEHLSLKSQDRKFTLLEARIICLKYHASTNDSKPNNNSMKHKMQPLSHNFKELNWNLERYTRSFSKLSFRNKLIT